MREWRLRLEKMENQGAKGPKMKDTQSIQSLFIHAPIRRSVHNPLIGITSKSYKTSKCAFLTGS